MSKFSRWTPTLGVCFKWDSQKVLKIAHLGVFRHIGGTWGVQKHMYLKVYWVKVISSKNGDFWTPQCWEINFFRQNICMFDWLYTETYKLKLSASSPVHHPRCITFHLSLRATRDWKFKSVTDQPTNRRTWVGARDVSKNKKWRYFTLNVE